MNQNLLYIQQKLKNNYDLTFRKIPLELGVVHLIFIKTITDDHSINEFIIQPLVQSKQKIKNMEMLKDTITLSTIGEMTKKEQIIQHLLAGDAILIQENSNLIYYCDVERFAHRAVEVPPTQQVIKGPREGFTEELLTNISLVRKRLQDAELKIENMNRGKKTKTELALIYIENRAPEELIHHVRTRLNEMNSDYILGSNYMNEQLQTKRTFFDTIGATEKPDIFVDKIVEGRVGILIEGDPFAVITPHFFLENFHSPNDYSENKYAANYFRIVRWVAFGTALLLPGLFIALTTHHLALLPRVFVFRLAINRAGVPFPGVIEFLIYMFLFQLLREAGLRLPLPIGQAISIVGALILGEAATKSGLASDITVMVVSLSSISTFLVPKIFVPVVVWSDVIIIFSALLGLPGFFIGFAVFCAHLAGITSSGYPYLYPLGTLGKWKFDDRIFRNWLNEVNKNATKRDGKS